MIITEKQLIGLIDILKDTLSIDNGFAINREQRLKLYETILNQQSDKFKEIE